MDVVTFDVHSAFPAIKACRRRAKWWELIIPAIRGTWISRRAVTYKGRVYIASDAYALD